jgi:hypothetical protein
LHRRCLFVGRILRGIRPRSIRTESLHVKNDIQTDGTRHVVLFRFLRTCNPLAMLPDKMSGKKHPGSMSWTIKCFSSDSVLSAEQNHERVQARFLHTHRFSPIGHTSPCRGPSNQTKATIVSVMFEKMDKMLMWQYVDRRSKDGQSAVIPNPHV